MFFIEHAEVHVFRNGAALLVIRSIFVHGLRVRDAKDDAGGGRVNVSACAVGFQHLRIAAVERTHAQLDLREIAGDKDVSLGREDKGANAYGVVGLARAVLHIGIPGGKPARLRRQRQKIRMNAPKINWHIEENASDIWGAAFDVDVDPGDRRTDIVVENKDLGLQMIFDAKYYQQTFVESYMNPNDFRTRTSHLNQLRGYLIDSEYEGKKVGALIYPMVNNDLKRGKVHPIDGTPIIIKTINLNTGKSRMTAPTSTCCSAA